jgi:hypothetical protein
VERKVRPVQFPFERTYNDHRNGPRRTCVRHPHRSLNDADETDARHHIVHQIRHVPASE